MKQSRFILPLALAAVLTLSSWGDVGHSMISFRINLSFNEEMEMFNDWVFYLTEHASDADWRKRDDPEEGPKHYIDIDNYQVFVDEGRIPQSLETCIDSYGEQFVDDNGYLPWATLAMYDSVVSCLRRDDMGNAKRFAADLGHYVADGHMPMHLTRNYDGQFTGNNGIHARYEIDMIGRYQDRITYTGTPARQIGNVEDYVFGYIYDNYVYTDSILIADDYATEMGEGTGNDRYYLALWERTENLTHTLFSKASHAIPELLYTAWVEAGRPGSTEQTGSGGLPFQKNSIQIIPNPVSAHATVRSSLPLTDDLSVNIYDAAGRQALQLLLPPGGPGLQRFAFNPETLPDGAYVMVLLHPRLRIAEPFIIAR